MVIDYAAGASSPRGARDIVWRNRGPGPALSAAGPDEFCAMLEGRQCAAALEVKKSAVRSWLVVAAS